MKTLPAPVDTFSEDVKSSMKSGRSSKQAIASALAVRRRKKMSLGQEVEADVSPKDMDTIGAIQEEAKFPAGASMTEPTQDNLPDNYDMPPSQGPALSDEAKSAILARKAKRRYVNKQ